MVSLWEFSLFFTLTTWTNSDMIIGWTLFQDNFFNLIRCFFFMLEITLTPIIIFSTPLILRCLFRSSEYRSDERTLCFFSLFFDYLFFLFVLSVLDLLLTYVNMTIRWWNKRRRRDSTSNTSLLSSFPFRYIWDRCIIWK